MDSLKTSSSYALYKAGQNKFTNWLKRTADSFNNANASSGKTSKPKQIGSHPSSAVHYSQLQSLTNTVVKNLPAEDIPLSIVKTLRDVVDLRRQSSEFFRKQSGDGRLLDEEVVRSNEGHLHIIKVLQNVLRVFDEKLRGRSKPQNKLDGSNQSVDKEEDRISNIYDNLELHQPKVGELDTLTGEMRNFGLNGGRQQPGKGAKKAKKSAKPGPKNTAVSSADVDPALSSMEYELVTEESDVQLLIYCFLEDFNKIRQYIEERWCDYKEGLVTLTAVALTTNTAFDLFQRAEKELKSQVPEGSVT